MMDRNQIIGIVLIGLIMVGFYHYTKPSEEQMAEYQRQRDSIAAVQQEMAAQAVANQPASAAITNEQSVELDSTYRTNKFGEFADYTAGEEQFFTLENEQLKVQLSNKGAKVYSVELKEYLTHDKKPLILFEGEEQTFNFLFFSNSNRQINTESLYFNTANANKNHLDFVITLADGKAMNISYDLPEEGYLLSTSIDGKKLENLIPRSQTVLDLTWKQDIRQVEKGLEFEQRYSGLYYKYFEDEVDFIRGSTDKNESLSTKVKWIAYKDQFFSSVLIADKAFASANIDQKKALEEGYTHNMTSTIAIPIDGKDINYQFYYGPNKYRTLKKVGYDLDRLVDMGRGPIRFINKVLVINVFNFLERFIGNYGLIILLLTIFIKLIVFPFTYRSYISTAKMRVLKPEIDEINERIPADKAMERQQATMALYKKAGASPLGGCLPMALSMPFLFAMFRFFPGSIELRQESFLWAQDLASYDAIISWKAQIPLLSKFYGNHISLFTILMAGTNIIYTRINQEMTASTSTMPGMKTMMYMMPIMFLFIFNKYSAGLSYYYFISTLITIGQTVFMRRLVNEDALHAQMQANKKKAPKKPSKFQQRLNEMQKQQQQMAKQQAKKRK